MALDDEHQLEQSEAAQLPGMNPQDQVTYDPTQGVGTDAWELSRRASMEANAQMRRN